MPIISTRTVDKTMSDYQAGDPSSPHHPNLQNFKITDKNNIFNFRLSEGPLPMLGSRVHFHYSPHYSALGSHFMIKLSESGFQMLYLSEKAFPPHFSVICVSQMWQNRFTSILINPAAYICQVTSCILLKLYRHKHGTKHIITHEVCFLPLYTCNYSDCVLSSKRCQMHMT